MFVLIIINELKDHR